MIVCEQDGTTWSPDEFETCPGCAVQMGEPVRRKRSRTPRAPSDANAALWRTLDVLNAQAASSEQAVAPAQEDSLADTANKGGQPAPVELSAQGGADEDEPEVSLEELAAMRKAKDFVIVLLGFPTAGKTFFLNRLQDELCSGTYTCRRVLASPDKAIENTIRFTAHRFQNPKDGDFVLIDIPGERFRTGAQRHFLGSEDLLMREILHTGQAFILMLPADETLLSHQAVRMGRVLPKLSADIGAQLESLAARIEQLKPPPKLVRGASPEMKAERARQERERREQRHAIVTQRRALLTSRTIRRLGENDRRLKQFISVIGEMAKLMSFVEMRSSAVLPPDFKAADLDAHKGSASYRKPKKPLMVVLSKADELYSREEGVRDAIDILAGRTEGATALLDQLSQEPAKVSGLKLVEVLRRPLRDQFDGWFENASFQWAVAFDGLPKDSQFVDYTLQHRGVKGVIDRIDQQKRSFLGWWPRPEKPT